MRHTIEAPRSLLEPLLASNVLVSYILPAARTHFLTADAPYNFVRSVGGPGFPNPLLFAAAESSSLFASFGVGTAVSVPIVATPLTQGLSQGSLVQIDVDVEFGRTVDPHRLCPINPLGFV